VSLWAEYFGRGRAGGEIEEERAREGRYREEGVTVTGGKYAFK